MGEAAGAVEVIAMSTCSTLLEAEDSLSILEEHGQEVEPLGSQGLDLLHWRRLACGGAHLVVFDCRVSWSGERQGVLSTTL
jgi:hypothetical protein